MRTESWSIVGSKVRNGSGCREFLSGVGAAINVSCRMPAAATAAGICGVVSFLTLVTNMSSPRSMRCVTYDSSGTLSVTTVPTPTLKDGDVMIEVECRNDF